MRKRENEKETSEMCGEIKREYFCERKRQTE